MADPYRFGTRSAATRALQQALELRGLYRGEIDGIFGHETREAVAAARQAFGLTPGAVDSALLGKLGLGRPNPFARLALGLLLSQLKGHLPMNFLSGYKTYIVAGAMLITGLAGMMGVDIPTFSGQAPGNLVMEALAFLFLRQGMKG